MSDPIRFFYESLPGSEESLVSSARSVPQWFKEIPRVFKNNDGENVPTAKHCFPFIEAFTTGYLLLTPEDYVVSRVEDGKATISSETTIIPERNPKTIGDMPSPSGYRKESFSWPYSFGIDIPTDCSIIFTQPFNRFELPFITITGIIDGPYVFSPGYLGFYIREDFEGVIPMGTPYAQVIPIKKQDFTMESKTGILDNQLTEFIDPFQDDSKYSDILMSNKDYYRRKVWQKKKYNI